MENNNLQTHNDDRELEMAVLLSHRIICLESRQPRAIEKAQFLININTMETGIFHGL